MNKTFTLSFFARIILVTAFFSITLTDILAQYADDPNRDQLPRFFRETPPRYPQLPVSTVITVNNYDNYNLGVDFGESNIAENPMQPTWFFTAYNTNDAHRTENGIDWIDSSPSFGATMQGDPVVSYDSIGNLYYQNMYGSSGIQGVKVMKSTNNGATWGPSVTGVAGVDKNWLACDQTNGPYANYVYNCMTASSGGNFSRSIDNGATYTTTFSPSTQSLPGMMVCVGANGPVQGKAVYVVTNSGSAFLSNYTFYRSLDGGLSFSLMSTQQFSNTVGTQVSGRNSVENMRTRPYPMIAADNSFGTYRGRLYCVFASNDPPGSGNKPDIWCRYSDDGGTTWNASSIRVNDDANPQSHHQWHPGIWCDKETGRLYAMWMDTRDCPTSDSALIYASYSDNGGVTWAANQAISNQKMKINCSTCGGGGTPRYQGDYNGIVSNKKVAMAGWTDFRQGSFMSVTAYFPDFAVALTPASGTVTAPSDSVDFTVSVPSVKLYSDTVVLSCVITPSPTVGTITAVYPQGNKITSFPGSKIVRLKLTGNVPAMNYQVNFFAKGPNGTPAHQRVATLTVNVSQALAVTTTANPSALCTGGMTQLQAFVAGGTGPYTYAWTSNPAGFTSTLPNPTASPLVSTRYICTVHDNTTAMVKDSVFVTVSSMPATPGAITGNTGPCANDTADYSIAPVTGATTYTWNVPTGAMILSGQNTTAVSVLWGTVSGFITVSAGNSCGNSPSSQLNVILQPLAPTPGAITGNTGPCANDTADYSILPVTGATSYTWNVPTGAIILSGQNTTAISVLWGTVSGYVTVSAVNNCGNGPASQLNVTLSQLAQTPGPVTGPSDVCDHWMVDFSVPAVAGVTNNWTVPSDALITAGQGTSAINVIWGSTSGYVSVTAENNCGISSPASMYVTVDSIPANAQAISGPDTVCQGLGGYQFSIPAIANATTYIWTLPQGASISQGQGTNSILVDFNGSALSGDITVAGDNYCGTGIPSSKFVNVQTCTGIGDNEKLSKVLIYPNPANDKLVVELTGRDKEVRIRITDLTDRTVYDHLLHDIPTGFSQGIDVSKFARGHYLVRITGNKTHYSGKITLQ
jgi:hypothetical protein